MGESAWAGRGVISRRGLRPVACSGTLLYTYRRIDGCWLAKTLFCLRDVVGGGWFVWAAGLC